ncbi:cytochrome P450 monooxygenase pc-2 [Pleurotus eryngii]|uniref:Cytochrome P450 monooxygenase pc-2 n=1 Tax=Pleurotus eryngii TaxID=5323 RepID=A0A9P5ZIH0_PLEER|nr:cytochrome P450 monooxygenase pc-2 [Pleurotus eryngii]
MTIPIGLVHLLKHLPPKLAPSLVTYVALPYGLRLLYPTHVSGLIILLASIIASPLYLIISTLYTNFSNRNAAAANGAVMPPYIEASWGGVSTIKAFVNNLKNGYPGDIFIEWCEKYGNTFSMTIFSQNGIFTTEPQYIKAILATQFDDFEKGPITFSQMGTLLGTGVFNSDGDRWKFHRSMTRPFFSKDRISDFDVFGRHADDALTQTKARLAAGYPIDFQDMVSRFTLDSATEFLFGQDVRSLSAGLPYPSSSPLSITSSNDSHPANVFATAFTEGQNVTSLRQRYGINWPLFEWNDRVLPHKTIVNRFVDPIISAAIAKHKARVAVGDVAESKEVQEEETLLDYLVKITQDHQTLQDEILNIMIAGRDTTACTLTFAVYMLAENPHVLKRVREEILEVVGPSRQPTHDDLRGMKYLRAFINETLRLYPAVPFNARASRHATLLPAKAPGQKPFYIPPMTTAVYSVFLMHRRTDLWGSDALKFDPDRFLDDRVEYITKNPFIFLPFNGGPRICLGQQFAYHESSFFLIRLLQRFSDFKLAPDVQPSWSKPPADWAKCPGAKGKEKVIPGAHLTMYVKGGLWLRMEEAKNAEST